MYGVAHEPDAGVSLDRIIRLACDRFAPVLGRSFGYSRDIDVQRSSSYYFHGRTTGKLVR